MKLIAEQVKYLRERKKDLEEKKNSLLSEYSNRETTSIEGVGGLLYGDFQHEADYHHCVEELKEIESILHNSEYLYDRNYEVIDLGTLFSVRFDDEYDEVDQIMLVDANSPAGCHHFVALDSDLGKVVLGKQAGDTITYTVSATGMKLSASIEEIDNIRNHYNHFIREKNLTDRICKSMKKELNALRLNDSEEYQKRLTITKSQLNLVNEELDKIRPNNPSDIAKKNYLTRVLHLPIAEPPKDNTIGIGSIVTVMLSDENGEVTEKKFELINRAFSTELDSDYVERISTFGNAIFGLQTNSTFKIPRFHQPSLNGIVVSVDNTYDVEKLRVK